MGNDNSFEKSYIVKCDCYGSALEIERDVWDKDYRRFWFSIWKRGRDRGSLCWRERIRWCWNILTTGNPWADDIIVTDNEAREIAEFILKHLQSEDTNETTKKN